MDMVSAASQLNYPEMFRIDPRHVLMNIQRANEFAGRYERAGAPIKKICHARNYKHTAC